MVASVREGMRRMLGAGRKRCQRNRGTFPLNGKAPSHEARPRARTFAVRLGSARPRDPRMSHYLGYILAARSAPTSAQTVARAIQLLRLVASSQSRNLGVVHQPEVAQLEK